MKKLVAAALVVAATLMLYCGSAVTAPKPADVPMKWELGFKFENPKPIQVTVPGDKRPSTFWYVLYTVTNQTGAEQVFVPEFVLYTDNGQILRSGENVPSAAFDKIKTEVNEPLLKNQAGVSGDLRQGANNAKQGVMIFTDIDAKAGSFDIFVGGLSGETAEITLPNAIPVKLYDRSKKEYVTEMRDKIFVSKTLQLHFALPGEAAARFNTPCQLASKTWVMR